MMGSVFGSAFGSVFGFGGAGFGGANSPQLDGPLMVEALQRRAGLGGMGGAGGGGHIMGSAFVQEYAGALQVSLLLQKCLIIR